VPLFDRKLILKVAKELDFRPEFLEKTLRLLTFLQDVGQHSYLGPRLTLRGGTAINLFLADAPRLSVDADLSYVGAEGRDEMLRERPELKRRLLEIAETQGYAIGRTADEHAQASQELTYTTVMGGKDKLKYETNFLLRIPLLPPVRKTAIALLEGVDCSFALSSPEEIYAGKTKALVERFAPQDLFDVFRLLESGELPGGDPIRYLTTFFLATIPNDPRSRTVERLPWPHDGELKNTLHPFIRKGDVPKVAVLKKKVEPFLKSLLKWDKRQSAFLDAVMGGKADGSLLFPDDAALAAKVSRHPDLLWKIQNLHRAR
jgi:hypothetical protein